MLIDLTQPISNETPVFPGDPKPEISQAATIEKNGYNEKQLKFNSHFATHIDAPCHMIENGKGLEDFPLETFFGEAVVLDAKNADISLVRKGDMVLFSVEKDKQGFKISKETTQKLIEAGVKIVGLDDFSIDENPFELHKMLLGNDILIVENLTNLTQLIGTRIACYVLPLKIKNADGAPCRVIASSHKL